LLGDETSAEDQRIESEPDTVRPQIASRDRFFEGSNDDVFETARPNEARIKGAESADRPRLGRAWREEECGLRGWRRETQ
jgi:hypothetical protein